jgi:AraC-like DNA-binding protein
MGDLIFIGSLFCSLISAYILVVKRRSYNSYSDKILGILFICYSYCTIGYLLIKSEWILLIPHFYKTAQPVNYLIPPLAFLYVRSILNNEKSFNWKDSFHFIPFLLFLINYIPLYLSSSENKYTLVQSVITNFELTLKNQDGFLPEYIQVIRPIQAFVYLVLQWKVYYQFKSQRKDQFQEFTLIIQSWIYKFNLIISLTVLTFIFFVIILSYGVYTGNDLKKIIFYASIPTAISLFYLSIYLLLNPNILIGLPFIEHRKYEEKEFIDISNYESKAKLVANYFESEKPFLRKNLTINEVSLATNIPLKSLSFIINQYYQQNFNDFVNGYRIAYFIEKIKNDALNNYTLYALSEAAGFSNKTTFLSAFKKVHNCTPSQYIQNFVNYIK